MAKSVKNQIEINYKSTLKEVFKAFFKLLTTMLHYTLSTRV